MKNEPVTSTGGLEAGISNHTMLLTKVAEKELEAIERERQAIEKEREAIQREREAIWQERGSRQQPKKNEEEEKLVKESSTGVVPTSQGEWEQERQQLKAEILRLVQRQEGLEIERDSLRAQVQQLRNSSPVRDAEGATADDERDHIQARETLERDKQEIEKIRVEIESIMKAWEAERDRQATERQQLETERAEVAALRREALGQIEWRRAMGMQGIANLASLGILPQPANFMSASPPLSMSALPSLASLALNHPGQSATSLFASSTPDSLSASANGSGGIDQLQQPLNFMGHSIHTTSPTSASSILEQQQHHPTASSQALPQTSVGHQLSAAAMTAGAAATFEAGSKRKRADSLGSEAEGWLRKSGSAGQLEFKKRRTVRPWEERFEELLHFKEKHGHFSVPAGGDYASLRIWVNNQKALHTKGAFFPPSLSQLCVLTWRCLFCAYAGMLANDRFDKLDAIGFPWWTPKGSNKGLRTGMMNGNDLSAF